jgi:AcrR family transcriptional regulator
MSPAADTTGPTAPAAGGGRPGLRERKKERTRKAIQFHALRLIEEQGYAATTVEQIADAVEISPSTFFRYFRNKEEAAVADFLDEAAFERVLAAPRELGPVEALAHGLRETFASMTDDDWLRELRRSHVIQSTPELQRSFMEDLARPMRLGIREASERLGLPEDSPEARAFGGALIGGLIALLIPLGDDTEEMPLPASREDALAMLQAGLDVLARILTPPS